MFFFFQAEEGIRDIGVTGVQTCALPISLEHPELRHRYTSRSRAVPLVDDDRRAAAARVGRTVQCTVDHLQDRKSVVKGKRVDLGGRRIIKKKKRYAIVTTYVHNINSTRL